jgi:Pyruvate/2-oxoacid:ferredoxin oxidoreductase delta subunit
MKKKSANHSSGPNKAPATQTKKITRMSSSSSSDEDDEAVVVSTDVEESDDEADSQCQYCIKYYSEDRHGEKSVQCTQCYIWCHEKCAGAERKRDFIFSTYLQ